MFLEKEMGGWWWVGVYALIHAELHPFLIGEKRTESRENCAKRGRSAAGPYFSVIIKWKERERSCVTCCGIESLKLESNTSQLVF